MTKNSGYICGTSMGRYSNPISITEVNIRWKNENGKRVKSPKKLRCENECIGHPKQCWFPYNEMYIQKWLLTNEETTQAIKNSDIYSLSMPSKILCPHCAKKMKRETKKEDEDEIK